MSDQITQTQLTRAIVSAGNGNWLTQVLDFISRTAEGSPFLLMVLILTYFLWAGSEQRDAMQATIQEMAIQMDRVQRSYDRLAHDYNRIADRLGFPEHRITAGMGEPIP